MRVRSTLDPSLRGKECKFVHAVDLRSRPEQIVPRNYFGNGIVAGATDLLSVNDVLLPDGLSLTASSIRYSIVHKDHLDAI